MCIETTPGKAKRGRFDKERTRQAILHAAREEFAEHGLSGARVDAIAARTNTVKRMLYYYFGSKEGLYLAVLEEAYAAIRNAEQRLDLLGLQPVKAIRRLIEFTFDYQEANPGFIRLVSIENIHNGAHVAQSEKIRKLNSVIVKTLATILKQGQEHGVFRDDVDAVDVHMLISAFCFFRVSNRHTFGVLFGRDLSDPALRDRHKRLVADAVLRTLECRQERVGRDADEGEKAVGEKRESRRRAAARRQAAAAVGAARRRGAHGEGQLHRHLRADARHAAPHRAGRLPVNRLMSGKLQLETINEGFDRLHEGKAVRQVIEFAQ